MTGNWETVRSAGPSLTVKSVPDGSYEIEVVAIDALGNRSETTSSRQTIDRISSGALQGGGSSFEAPQGFAATALSPTLALLTWTAPVTAGLRAAIRHTPDSGGGSWGAASSVIPDLPLAAAGQAHVPALSGCYLLRFLNDQGIGSLTVAVAQFTQSPTLPFAYAANYLESASNFAGAKVNCAYDSSIGALRLNRTYWDNMGAIDSLATLIDDYGAITVSTTKIDDLADAGDWDAAVTLTIDEYGVDNRIATYSFQNQLDLGGIYDVELVRTIRAYSLALPITWDAITGLVDDAVDIDGEITDGGQISIEYSASTEAAATAAKWSEWAPLSHCYAFLRSLRLRARLIIDDVAQDVAALELGVAALLPQRIETSATLTSSAATYAVTFTSAFYSAPSVLVTPFDLATGDYYQITLLTAAGFSVTFRNNSGTAVARSFQYQATGFGRMVAVLAPPPPPAPPSDPDFASVSLLLPMNGSNGSTTFTDESNNALTVTAQGGAAISTAQSKWGGSSAYFDSIGDWLAVAASSALAMGTGALTVEFWMYPLTTTDNDGLFSFTGTSGGIGNLNASLQGGGANLDVNNNGGGGNAKGAVAANVWQFVQITRSGTTVTTRLDGTQLGSTDSWSTDFNTNMLDIGLYYGSPFTYHGYLQDFRVTKGVARANVVPTAAFPTS